MYKYTDLIDFAIRKFAATNVMTEYDLLQKMSLSGSTLARCRKSKKISRPMIVRFQNVGVNFKWIKFEVYEW